MLLTSLKKFVSIEEGQLELETRGANASNDADRIRIRQPLYMNDIYLSAQKTWCRQTLKNGFGAQPTWVSSL
jgi:hypothetical protein